MYGFSTLQYICTYKVKTLASILISYVPGCVETNYIPTVNVFHCLNEASVLDWYKLHYMTFGHCMVMLYSVYVYRISSNKSHMQINTACLGYKSQWGLGNKCLVSNKGPECYSSLTVCLTSLLLYALQISFQQ